MICQGTLRNGKPLRQVITISLLCKKSNRRGFEEKRISKALGFRYLLVMIYLELLLVSILQRLVSQNVSH